MKGNKILRSVSIIINIIFFTLVGCTTTVSIPTIEGEVITAVYTSTATLISPTQTSFTATQTPTATPTLTSTPSSTPISTSTTQPTATETPYAIPTPPGVSAAEQILWLFETNNGCQLPCWWGITPGQTDWPTSQEFLATFDSNIYEVSINSGLTYHGVRIPLLPEVFLADHTELSILVHEGLVEKIFTDISFGDTPPGYLTPYSLSMFLTAYGQPSEVWLFTYRSPFEENDLPFAVVLFYAEQGIVALYSNNGERQGDLVRGCPQKDVVSFLGLWTPSLDLTFEQIIEGTSALERDYLSLGEATDIDVVTFYNTFKNPDNLTCLETPANLWR